MIEVVFSRGSRWELDDDLMRYRRMPREERPRERQEWSDERAGSLQDFTWHEMLSWGVHPYEPALLVEYEAGMYAYAPLEGSVWHALSETGRVVSLHSDEDGV